MKRFFHILSLILLVLLGASAIFGGIGLLLIVSGAFFI